MIKVVGRITTIAHKIDIEAINKKKYINKITMEFCALNVKGVIFLFLVKGGWHSLKMS